MTITRIAPFPAAKVVAVLYASLGLFAGAIFSLAALSGFMGTANPGRPFASILFGGGSLIVLPIMYGIFGFIGTLLMTAVYNLVAGAIGGIEVEVR
jgi:hypothetical protein